jgi:ribosomal protein L29
MGKPFANLLVLLTAVLGSSVLSATELYRYVNDKGVVVLDRQGVPPDYVAKGYEVLNEQGRVIRVVPPAPSPEEMKRIIAERARAGSDKQLLRLYSTPEDVERAKQRKVAELDGLISVAKGNLLSLRSQQANLQSQAAEHERAGREVPDHLIAQIESLKSEQANLRRNVASYEDVRKQSEASFDADRERLRELLERSSRP